ncbi:MAG: cytochrome b [Caulobacterales bacterium]
MTAAAGAAPSNAAAPDRSRYSAVAIVLHWLIAILILSNIGLAWYFNTLKGPAEVAPLMLHKSIGVTVLILSIGRVGWRLATPAVKLPDEIHGWERWLIKGTHLVFYILILALPLTGWAMVSASPLIKVHPTVLFGLVHWPAMPFPGLDSDQLHTARKAFQFTHSTLAKVAYLTIALHVAGALKHQFFNRDHMVSRMIPFLRRQGAA